jgi:hypothetical protein
VSTVEILALMITPPIAATIGYGFIAWRESSAHVHTAIRFIAALTVFFYVIFVSTCIGLGKQAPQTHLVAWSWYSCGLLSAIGFVLGLEYATAGKKQFCGHAADEAVSEKARGFLDYMNGKGVWLVPLPAFALFCALLYGITDEGFRRFGIAMSAWIVAMTLYWPIRYLTDRPQKEAR